MKRNWPLFVALAAILAIPICLRPKTSLLGRADLTLVIVTAHNEAIRSEFARAFADFMRRKRGQTVRIDWRTPGGLSEIGRFLGSEYAGSFENYWTNKLRRPWTKTVQTAYDNPAVQLPLTAESDTEAQTSRRVFLASDVGCGIDLMFSGGSFDLGQQAAAGRLVDAGVIAQHAEIFNDQAIPQSLGGEPFWDRQHRWIGCCLSSFGICFNVDSLARLGVSPPPAQWSDLANPRLAHEVALADPTKSGSAAKAYEMVIQQQIAIALAKVQTTMPATTDAEAAAVREGWLQAMLLLRKIGANCRYFADSATRIPLDVATGDAAAGMCIDFYGRFQAESANAGTSRERMRYVSPRGGTSVGVDGIGLLRGAPHPELAREFIEFVLSIEGQKLWNWKVGTPGGPVQYALRRLPIRPELYDAQYATMRSDPEVNSLVDARSFHYEPRWTAALFRTIGFVVREMCIDPHDELSDAWQALIAAGFPPEAMAKFSDVSAFDYDSAVNEIAPILKGSSKLDEAHLSERLVTQMRRQYRAAAELAREGR